MFFDCFGSTQNRLQVTANDVLDTQNANSGSFRSHFAPQGRLTGNNNVKNAKTNTKNKQYKHYEKNKN